MTEVKRTPASQSILRKVLSFLGIARGSDLGDYAVVVDFVLEKGLLFVAIKNTASRPVFKVSVEFDQKIVGVEGSKEISALPLFRNIEFLAPQKEIRTFLDTSASYFKREQPTEITIRISYYDSRGTPYSDTIRHNLEIYRDIGYIG